MAVTASGTAVAATDMAVADGHTKLFCNNAHTDQVFYNPVTKIFVQKIEPITCLLIRSPKYLYRK